MLIEIYGNIAKFYSKYAWSLLLLELISKNLC